MYVEGGADGICGLTGSVMVTVRSSSILSLLLVEACRSNISSKVLELEKILWFQACQIKLEENN